MKQRRGAGEVEGFIARMRELRRHNKGIDRQGINNQD